MPPETAEVRLWLQKAEHDRRAAEVLSTQTPPITDGAAFHCQQAVEKTLRAYLVSRGQAFEKIHDLRAMANLCADHDSTFADLRDCFAALTPFAARFLVPHSRRTVGRTSAPRTGHGRESSELRGRPIASRNGPGLTR